MDMEEESLALNDLGTKQKDMKLRNAKRKFKDAVHLVSDRGGALA